MGPPSCRFAIDQAGRIANPSSTIVESIRVMIDENWARVALPSGLNRPPPIPLTQPASADSVDVRFVNRAGIVGEGVGAFRQRGPGCHQVGPRHHR